MMNFEDLTDSLTVKVVNTENNKDYLADKPTEKIEDSLGEITILVVVGVLLFAIVGFVVLLILFISKNIIYISRGYYDSKYRPLRLITKEGYISMTICILVIGMLFML